jgi:hypothetical protein
MSTSPQSNQNAGVGKYACPWCRLWNAAVAASWLDPDMYADPEDLNWSIWVANGKAWGDKMRPWLAYRNTTCKGCQRFAEIQRGDFLGDERRAWRAAMWAENPSMRFMMRQGSTETFQEDAK